MLKTLKYFEVKNRRVLIRVDFNVPMEKDKVTDNFRIQAVLPTIRYCLDKGAAVVLMSHLGRPKGKPDKKFSLIPAGETLADLLEMPVKFSHDCISEDARDVSLGLKAGEVHLLENLRFYNEEQNKDFEFCTLLSRHGQIFINDAFGTSHRVHASNVGVAELFPQRGIGKLIEKELHYLNGVISKPKRPFTLVLGGAKLKTKLKLIRQFLNKADSILIGGGMAFTFFKALGKNVGTSLIDENLFTEAKKILDTASQNKVDILLPVDVVCAKENKPGVRSEIFSSENIPDNQMGLDIGPRTVSRFQDRIMKSKACFWNGPLGVFETAGFEHGTHAVATALGDAFENGSTVVVGGGDSALALKNAECEKRVTHVSTGGGASLKLVSGESLPALKALEI